MYSSAPSPLYHDGFSERSAVSVEADFRTHPKNLNTFYDYILNTLGKEEI